MEFTQTLVFEYLGHETPAEIGSFPPAHLPEKRQGAIAAVFISGEASARTMATQNFYWKPGLQTKTMGQAVEAARSWAAQEAVMLASYEAHEAAVAAFREEQREIEESEMAYQRHIGELIAQERAEMVMEYYQGL